jgi:LSD1 subclass zinc finger protein
MNCPACGAPMQLKPGMDSFKCEYCQSVYFPDKNDDGVRVLADQTDPNGLANASVQNCPVCNIALKLAAVDKFRILYCATCHGMLIPMEEFQVLIDDLQALQRDTIVQPAPDSSDLRRTINCPQCHYAMEAHFYMGPGNVTIDSCDTCSVNWLDHGELMRIVHAPDERHPATSFVSNASAYGDDLLASPLPIDDPALGLRGFGSPYSYPNRQGPDLFDAIASLFVR